MTVEDLLAGAVEGKARSNLVVVRAGPCSRHIGWCGDDRNYDLLVCAYDRDAPVSGEEARVLIPGRKVEGLSKLFDSYPALLDHYERIAMIDDDIAADSSSLSNCFAIGANEGLAIWQPALKAESYFSYAAFVENGGFRLRYVNFIEMMCPFFQSAFLRKALVLMDQGWETGIDTIWCRQFEQPRRRCAVVDATAVLHSRPVGQFKVANGFTEDEVYDRQVAKFLREIGTSFHGPVTYAGITATGVTVSSRLGIFLRSVRMLASIFRSPMGLTLTLRLVLAHLRHVLTRPINDGRVF